MVKHLYTFPPTFRPIRRKCYITSDLLQNEKCKLFRRHSVKSYTISARLCASLSYLRLREIAHPLDYCAKTLYKIGHERKRSGQNRLGALFSVQDFRGVVRGIGNGFQFSGFRFGIRTSVSTWLLPIRTTGIARATGKPETVCQSCPHTKDTTWPFRRSDNRNADMD